MRWLDRTEYPFTPHYFEVDGARLHYVDEGPREARPVVFVHGLPAWSFEYREFIKTLSPRYRCIAPDALGAGLSDKPATAAYRPQDHARRLAALIEHLELRGVVLVVNDFGGPIGLAYAIEHPEKVATLVVSNTWLWPLDGEAVVRRADVLLRGPLGALLYKYFAFSPRVMMPYAWGKAAPLTKRLHQHYLAVTPTPASRTAQLELARSLVGSGVWYAELWRRRERLRDKPALLLWGLRDPTFMGRALPRWQEVLPKAETHAFPDVGHFVPDEAGELAAPLVAAFLAPLA